MTLLNRLLRRLQLDSDAPDHFMGGSGAGGVTADSRLFGGLVAAQAVMAVCRTVESDPMHSLHAYFLRPGRPDADIRFEVVRAKEGRNFKVRLVTAWQSGERIFLMQASFQRPEPGVSHQTDMPDTPAPETLPNRDQLRGRDWTTMPLDIRMGTTITERVPAPPEQRIWLRPNGPLPEDPRVHLAMLVYASDRTLLETAWRPHADQGELAGASLDHSMWFHTPPRFDAWVLYDMHSPAAGAGRGLALGAMYDSSGTRMVSIAQEGVLRVR